MVRSLLTMVTTLLPLACGFGSVDVIDPPEPEKASVSVTVLASDAPEAAVALGWSAGIPEATVRLDPIDARGGLARTVISDAHGLAFFDHVPVGVYQLSVSRLLDPQELLTAIVHDVAGFSGRATIDVGSPETRLEFVASPARRRPLVISEFSFNQYYEFSTGTYATGGFIELYNAADTTIWLDGMVIGNAFAIPVEGGLYTCMATDWIRNDPTGTWSEQFEMFPGSGREHPLEPGRVAVIATDAVDHSAIIDGLLDLSSANFEFFGGIRDIDNPHVPNMIDVGVRPAVDGHGLNYPSTWNVPFVAAGLDPDALQRRANPVFTNIVYARIPLETIMDIAAFRPRNELLPEGSFNCPDMTHDNLDLDASELFEEYDYLRSFVRKRIGTLPDGRPVLQHTRTTAADFTLGPRTPGSIPPDNPASAYGNEDSTTPSLGAQGLPHRQPTVLPKVKPYR